MEVIEAKSHPQKEGDNACGFGLDFHQFQENT